MNMYVSIPLKFEYALAFSYQQSFISTCREEKETRMLELLANW